MNRIQEHALAMLSGEWQRLPDLSARWQMPDGPILALEDLVEYGQAERQIVPVYRGTHQAGCRIYYRRRAA